LLTILCFIAILAGIALLIVRAAKRKRRESMARLAERLGYGFTENPGYCLADRYGSLPRIVALGKRAKARNLVHGERGGIRVRILDCTGTQEAPRPWGRVVVLEFPGREFPAFLLRPEGPVDKLAAAFGHDDIDFEENEEFSKRYYVSSSDEGFARKVLNERQMEMLLAMDDVRIEMGHSAIAFYVEEATLPAVEQLHGLAWRFIGNIPELAPEPEAGDDRTSSGRRTSALPRTPAFVSTSVNEGVIVVGILLWLTLCVVVGTSLQISGWPLGVMIVVGISGFVAIVVCAAWLQAKRRRDGMARLAARLGYRFTPRPRPDLLEEYSSQPPFPVRKGERAKNLIHGERDGIRVRILDFPGPESTPWSVVLLEMPGRDFPLFRLRLEQSTDRIAAAAGFEDIGFESDEFSRKYHVTCKDRRFAYDVVTARQMEMLLTLDDINIGISGRAMAFYLEPELSPMEIEWLHGIAWRFVGNIPEFVLERKGGGGDARSAATTATK
jgi:hypothetical protein